MIGDGPSLTLVGFERDVGAALDAATDAAFSACGGKIVQNVGRRQSLHLRREVQRQDLSRAFLPPAGPLGPAAVVPKNHSALHDGLAAEAGRLAPESLVLRGAPVRAEAPCTAAPAFTA
jgi:3-(3-hydroxy-phenyl)propionate hydroxylase